MKEPLTALDRVFGRGWRRGVEVVGLDFCIHGTPSREVGQETGETIASTWQLGRLRSSHTRGVYHTPKIERGGATDKADSASVKQDINYG